MRAWWWVLITANLVWGRPEQFKDDYGNTSSLKTGQNVATSDKVYLSFVLNPNGLSKRAQTSSSEGDEREKKQQRFHSWGGKRYGDEEEEELGDNSDLEEDVVLFEPGDEELLAEISYYLSSFASRLENDGLGERFREALTKRGKSFPRFSSQAGKRDPEIVNGKRSNFYRNILQQKKLDYKPEQNRKNYPFFSSWAGKRAFNSWGGKRDFPTQNGYDPRVKRDYFTTKRGYDGNTENHIHLNNDQTSKASISLNSDLLDSEDNLSFQDHDTNIDKVEESSSRSIPEDKVYHSTDETNFLTEFENPTLRRTLAFNSWDGKRTAAFNNWGGKRAAAFNSWGGKRAPAFNSWGGKRAPSFNSWGGKRAAGFNSWGGKRAAAFNSWGGKRAAAFNSWGGKRAAAFNSWGGKRATAFNSWGGKRAAAFNSWGGKRDFDKQDENSKFGYPTWIRDLNDVNIPVPNIYDTNFEKQTNEHLSEIDKVNKKPDYFLKNAYKNNLDKTKENMLKHNYYVLLNDKHMTDVDTEEVNNHKKDNNQKNIELLGHRDSMGKRFEPSFTSWAGKRSPLFSSWYGGKIPTVLLMNGKRRPAFSSWGGKRSEHNEATQPPENTDNEEDATIQAPEEEQTAEPEEKTYMRKRREVECSGKNTSSLQNEREKRASGSFPKNRVFTRMMIRAGRPMAQQSKPREKFFFPWGGKRSFPGNILR